MRDFLDWREGRVRTEASSNNGRLHPFIGKAHRGKVVLTIGVLISNFPFYILNSFAVNPFKFFLSVVIFSFFLFFCSQIASICECFCLIQ